MRRRASVAFAGAVLASFFALAGTAAAACPNEAIREAQGTTALPDCRAFEKVTPADKGGVDIVGGPQGTKPRPLFRSSLDGSRFMYASQAGFAGTEGVSWPSSYLAVRGDGWGTRGLIPPQRANVLSLIGPNSAGKAARVEAVSRDLSLFSLSTRFNLLPGASEDVETVYVRSIDAPAGSQYELVSPEGPGIGDALINEGTRPSTVAATDDMRYVLFSSAWPLNSEAPGPTFAGTYLYLWSAVDGTLELVSRAVDNSVMTTTAGTGATYRYIPNAISADGRRVYFRSEYGSTNGGPIYMRDTVADTTVQISEGASNTMTASADGDRLLFFSAPSGLGRVAVYDADTESEQVVIDEAELSAPLAASDDLSRVYFLSKEEPVAGQPSLGGEWGIYLWDEGQTSYVATLNGGGGELVSGGGVFARYSSFYGGWTGRAEVGTNADGSQFALHTSAQLTGYDSRGTTQVYTYDAEASTPTEPALACASCPPGAPTGDARISAETMTSFTSSSSYSWVMPRRGAIADDGSVFFQSPDSLLPADTNGRIDVYEWSDGGVALLSTGTDGHDAEFVDSSASGGSAFFITRGRLLSSDRDDLLDAYSATVSGGFVEPPPPGEPCRGSACQGDAPPTPGVGQPSSASLHGPGNAVAAPSRCAKLRQQANRKGAKAKRVGGRQAKKLRAQAKKLRAQAKRCSNRKGAGR